jgi:hypothetical protein
MSKASFAKNYLELQVICCYTRLGESESVYAMNNRMLLLSCAVLIVARTSTITLLAQTVVTFDSPPLNAGYIGSSYQGLSWSNFYCENGILSPDIYPSITNGFYYGVVSPSNVVINGLGQPAEIDSATNFDFLSAYLTGGWHSNLNIEVEGFRSGGLLYDTTVVATATSPTLFTFDYLDVDRLYFNSYGGDVAFGYDGGAHFVMDNLTFEFIPEPSSFLLTSTGALLLWPLLKRKRA